MDDLVTWLRGVLDERERLARAVPDDAWREDVGADEPGINEFDPAVLAYINSNAPADTLREVTAKRRIVEVAVSRWKAADLLPDGHAQAAAAGALAIVQLLALPHAGWPGYRDEWRP